ncbi:MAG: hypothetical protein AABW72_00005 [archaeon]
MYKLNQKGQTFSTFKLLISAIVAIALLTILFNIMGMIPSLGQQDPQTKAIDLVKKATNPEYTPQKAKVQFTKGNTIGAKAIAQQGIGYEICVSTGELANDAGFGTSVDGILINYSGSAAKNVSLVAMCGTATELDVYAQELQATGGFPTYTCSNLGQTDDSVCILTISKSTK